MPCSDLSSKFALKSEVERLKKEISDLKRCLGKISINGSAQGTSNGQRLQLTVATPCATGTATITIPTNNNCKCKDGKNGKNGRDGKDGKNGINGKDGKNGKNGKDGKQGEKGQKGDKGDRGLKGQKGDRGLNGRDGRNGKNGVNGSKGAKGDKGERGINGFNGTNGINGRNGRDGVNGRNGRDGTNGRNGRDGRDGRDGKDGKTPTSNEIENIINRIVNNKPDKFSTSVTLVSSGNDYFVRITRNDGVTLTSNKVTMKDYTEILNQIKSCCDQVNNKVSLPEGFTIPVEHCSEPENEGEWYELNNLDNLSPATIGEALQIISNNQLHNIHEDTCKGVQPLAQIDNLPIPYECVEDENGNKTYQPMSEENLALAGIPLLPAIPWIGKRIVAPFLGTKILDYFFNNVFPSQTENDGVILCNLENNGDCAILVDDISVRTSYKYYLQLYWEWTNKDINSNAGYWIIRNPIEELINPTNPENIWDTYFANISYIVGFILRYDYSMVHDDITGNKINIKVPLLKGYFSSEAEADRVFNLLRPLSKEVRNDTFNNPTSPAIGRSNIKYAGEMKQLRKVCVIVKGDNSNETQVIASYVKPKITP